MRIQMGQAMSEKMTELVITLQNLTEVRAMKQIISEYLFLSVDGHINPSEEAKRVATEIDRYISTHEESP